MRSARTSKVALTCIEEDPERCHRHLLLGKTLTDRGADVQHIRHAGYLESQTELDERMCVTGCLVHRGRLALADPDAGRTRQTMIPR